MPTQSAPAATLDLATARAQFGAHRGYLSACTMGLPIRATADALRADLARWFEANASAAGYGTVVAAAREHFARLASVPLEWVSIGSQVSVMAGLFAASAPDDAEILCVDGDFSSMVYPFLQQQRHGIRVRHVPLESLADSIDERTWLVAFSLVQSATGCIADADTIAEAARRCGAFTLCDMTQSAGWLPVEAARFDATLTHTYKWLCSPRGVAFMTVSPAMAAVLTPVHAGWYAGDDPWQSCYGPQMNLAADARRFDVSPAWQAWVGAEPALEFFSRLDARAVAAYDGGLGDALSAELGLPQNGQAIVTWADPDGSQLAKLTHAGIVASGRAGRARVAFHLWNDESDVAAVLRALGR